MLTRGIIGCAITIHKALGPGYPEAHYQNALAVELATNGIPFEREVSIRVLYRGHDIGMYYADFVVGRLIAVETKASAAATEADHRQLLNYLRVSDPEIGLLVNFGWNRVQVCRKVYDNKLESVDVMDDPGAGVPESPWRFVTGEKVKSTAERIREMDANAPGMDGKNGGKKTA